MLEKIKEDIANDLESIIEKYGEFFRNYEISDDVRRVLVAYEAPKDTEYSKVALMQQLMYALRDQIERKLQFYSRIKDGRSAGFGEGEGVRYVEDSG